MDEPIRPRNTPADFERLYNALHNAYPEQIENIAVQLTLEEARALVAEALAAPTDWLCESGACRTDPLAFQRAMFTIDPDGITRSLVARGFYVHGIQIGIR